MKCAQTVTLLTERTKKEKETLHHIKQGHGFKCNVRCTDYHAVPFDFNLSIYFSFVESKPNQMTERKGDSQQLNKD